MNLLIFQHTKAVNSELLLTAWQVGGYVSAKLKSKEWGSKVVSQLSEFIRSNHPDTKGFSRRNIYNIVMFYDEYSSEVFAVTVSKYMNTEFVQPETAQIENCRLDEHSIIVQSEKHKIKVTDNQ